MNYDLVMLEAKTVTGRKIRTRNDDPGMPLAIGNLWQSFYAEETHKRIAGAKNANPLGLYTNYEDSAKGFYDLLVCVETDGSVAQPEDLVTREIPAGKYAKFIVSGGAPQDVGAFWGKLWAMNLDRKFDSDYEEYIVAQSGKTTEVHVYISLNESNESNVSDKSNVSKEDTKMEELYCQSCGMPLSESSGMFAKEADGKENRDYCMYCYADGKFTADVDMDGMIEACVPFFVEAQPGMTEESARQQMKAYFPMLKRWAKV